MATERPAEYATLKRLTLSKEFLKNKSTIYQFEFGAIAELADNARDANAKTFKIFQIPTPDYTVKFGLGFLDDGHGISPTLLNFAICCGKSNNKDDASKIGEYGLGLKSASMRLGSDMILFTKYKPNKKATEICSILLLSNSLNIEMTSSDVIVPLPSFNPDCKTRYRGSDSAEHSEEFAEEKFKDEMKLIYKYSPFKNNENIKEMFKRIESTGTLVFCYNLKYDQVNRNDVLKIDPNDKDILINDYWCSLEDRLKLEYESLRAFLSILYYKPRMKMYIFDKKVRSKLFIYDLYGQMKVTNEFKSLDKLKLKEIENAKKNLKEAETDLNDKKSHLNNLQSDPRKADRVEIYRNVFDLAVNNRQAKVKELEQREKDAKIITKADIIFGLNIENRFSDGIFIYNNDRLVIMHEKPLKSHLYPEGICAIINLPYHVLEVSESKQNFTDDKQYKLLIKNISDFFHDYLEQIKMKIKIEMNDFWTLCGYSIDKFMEGSKDRPCDTEIKFRDKPTNCRDYRNRVRFFSFVQCDLCLKWRKVNDIEKKFKDLNYPLDDWNCSTVKGCCADKEVLEDIKVLLPVNRSNIPSEPRTSNQANYVNSFNSPSKTNGTIFKSISTQKKVFRLLNPNSSDDDEQQVSSQSSNSSPKKSLNQMIVSNRAKLNIASKVRSVEATNFKTCQRDNVVVAKRSITIPDRDEPTSSKINQKETKRFRTVEPTQDSFDSLKEENKDLRNSLKTILTLHANYLDDTQKSGETQTEMVRELSNQELRLFNVVEFFNRTVYCLESRITEDERVRLMTALEKVVTDTEMWRKIRKALK